MFNVMFSINMDVRKSMRLLALLTCALFTLAAHAEPDNTCWGEPVNIAVVDIAAAPFPSNKKGAEAKMGYKTNPDHFSGVCNRSNMFANQMRHYIDMGPELIPSNINPGYFKLSDDVDILISSSGYNFPLGPETNLYGPTLPPYGQNVRVDGLAAAGSGDISLKLRRDIIGGAIVAPADTVLFSVFRVIYMDPIPPRPSRPLIQAHTKSAGQVIPIPAECSINRGETIEINYGTLQTVLVPAVGSGGDDYVKHIALSFSCNANLTQDVQVKLVSDVAGFSADLIRSDNSALGFALKHNNQIIKPQDSFHARIEGGVGNTEIAISPVRDPKAALNGGAFNASATLVILSL